MEIGNLIVRPFQLFFVAVILGLSIALVKEQQEGTAPSLTTFCVACGVFGAISFFTGIVAVFVNALQGLVMLVLDGITTLFFFAGSIALAVRLGVHSCDGNRPKGWNDVHYRGRQAKKDHWKPPNPYCTYNQIISGGAIDLDPEDSDVGFTFSKPNDWFVSRCRMAQALDAFMFFALIAFSASLVFDLLGFRRNKSASAA